MLKSNIIFKWKPFKNMYRSLNTIKITNPFPSNENYSLEFYNTYSMSHTKKDKMFPLQARCGPEGG